MEQYRFFTRIGNNRREVFPLNGRSLKLQYSRLDSERRHAFVEGIEGDLVFGNHTGDYAYLYAIEQNNYRCRSIVLEIEKRGCDNQYSIWKTAVLRLINGSFDEDACTLTIRPEIQNDYSCWDESKDKEVNLLSLPVAKVTVHHLKGALEYFQYTSTTGYTIDDPAQFGGQHPSAGKWKCYKAEFFNTTNPDENRFYYVREVLTLPAGEVPGDEWVIVGNVGADVKWARLAVFGDYTQLFVNNQVPAEGRAPIRYFGGKLFAYNIVGADIAGSFDNGMPVASLLSYFVSNACGLRIKSNFLQINPTRSFEEEYPLFEPGRTYHNILYQKSDMKRPNVSNNATIANFTARKLLSGICQAYNLWWRIENGEFIIEHVSFFQRAYTLDITMPDRQKRVVRTRKYSYESDKLPRFEMFSFMETGRPDFAGVPIEYPGDCATDAEGANKRDTLVENITTDIELCLINSDPDSKIVSDEGFALVAATFNADTGLYSTITVAATLEEEPHVNNCLGWAYLHKMYHRHERLQLNGYLNGVYQNFLSVVPVKKRVRIAVKFCCGDQIDLGGLVYSDMGDAIIGAGTLLLHQEELELDLLYTNASGNQACLKPARFLFHHFEADAFFFDTSFWLPGSYVTDIEAIRPDGTRQTFANYTDEGGIVPATFDPYEPGIWRFRKKVFCDIGYESPYTDYVVVDTTAQNGNSACATTALATPVFITHFGGSKFLFRFAGLTLSEAIEVEVVRPNGNVSVRTGVRTVYTGGTDVTVDAANAGEAAVPNGAYQFRFRKVCDAAAGLYSLWSNTVAVVK